jgi:hypothetical protein
MQKMTFWIITAGQQSYLLLANRLPLVILSGDLAVIFRPAQCELS